MIRELPRQGLSISEISRQTGHDRRTIRKIPDDPRHPAPYQRRKRGSNLDPYKPYLRRQTAAGVLNAVKLVQEVRRQDYTGGITLFRQFLHPLQPSVPVVTQRLKTPSGHQRQVDWAPCGLVWHQDRPRPLSAFVMPLGCSRRQYVEFTTRQDKEAFLRCHVNAYRDSPGCPLRCSTTT